MKKEIKSKDQKISQSCKLKKKSTVKNLVSIFPNLYVVTHIQHMTHVYDCI